MSLLGPLDHAMLTIDANVWTPVSRASGLEADQVAFLVCMISSYFFAVLLRYTKNPFQRHIFGISVGLIYGLLVYKTRIFNNLLVALVTYAIVYFGRGKASTPWLVFLWSFGYLCCSHYYRVIYEYGIYRFDFTASLMISALKDVSFAFDTYDADCSKEKKEKKFEFPSLVEYFGYIFFFPGFLCGPYFDFQEYQAFASMEMFNEFGKQVPYEPLPILKNMGSLLLFGSLNLLKPIYPVAWILTEDFDRQSALYKIGYLWLSCVILRSMYYFAWLLSETGCIICGLSYNGKDQNGNLKWDRATNIKPYDWEMSQNMHDAVGFWNIRVMGWLKKYIYLRVRPGKKPGMLNSVATYIVSAFWHGFYPGYYLFFLTLPIFYVPCEKALRRSIRTLFLHSDGTPNYPAKYAYDLITAIITPLMVSYAALSFAILSFEDTISAWSKFYFMGHVLCGLVIILDIYKLLPSKKIAVSKRSH
eukprot:TRINITY_DN496_c0_g1_i1.p1 TRINITY_DN496_c0_g1~~TRINITY_DN496_c0_g1_i1.p1  ORF type:complete len:474 (+),score=72.26 TRINITY_DN496_c0_g1_i1:19-1440(+)